MIINNATLKGQYLVRKTKNARRLYPTHCGKFWYDNQHLRNSKSVVHLCLCVGFPVRFCRGGKLENFRTNFHQTEISYTREDMRFTQIKFALSLSYILTRVSLYRNSEKQHKT